MALEMLVLPGSGDKSKWNDLQMGLRTNIQTTVSISSFQWCT